MKKAIAIVLVAAALVLAGCADGQVGSSAASNPSQSASLQAAQEPHGPQAGQEQQGPQAEQAASQSSSASKEQGNKVSVAASDSRGNSDALEADPSEASVGQAGQAQATTQAAQPAPDAAATTITLQVNDASFQMGLADTEAALALVELLREAPVSVPVHAYGGFEEVGPLPQALPASDEQITTAPGDVMLYQGSQITIFHGSNTWAYTPLGHIQDATSETLREAFGEGDTVIELSL